MVPVKDTVWWNTAGGTVTEHRDRNGATCALSFHDRDSSVTVLWNGSGRTSVTAADLNWQLPSQKALPVAMQVGDTWLSNGANSVVLQATGSGNAVTFGVTQPVETLLGPANRIRVRITGATLSITLSGIRVDHLLSRARMCRDAIRR